MYVISNLENQRHPIKVWLPEATIDEAVWSRPRGWRSCRSSTNGSH